MVGQLLIAVNGCRSLLEPRLKLWVLINPGQEINISSTLAETFHCRRHSS